MIRVSIVIGDRDLRERLRALASSPRIELAVDADGAAAAAPGRADVVIVDEREPLPMEIDSGSGLLVVGGTASAARAARESGSAAWGVLPADVTRSQLQAAIEAIAAGLVVLSPALPGRRADLPVDAGDEPIDEPLTPRERDVLALVAEGLANRDVAQELGISEHTVKFHLAAVYGKLGASTRTEAVRRALRRGLIDL